MKVLKNIQYQYQVGLKVLKKDSSIPIPQAGLKVLQKIQYQYQAGLKVLKKDSIPIPGWFESVKKKSNINTGLVVIAKKNEKKKNGY